MITFQVMALLPSGICINNFTGSAGSCAEKYGRSSLWTEVHTSIARYKFNTI